MKSHSNKSETFKQNDLENKIFLSLDREIRDEKFIEFAKWFAKKLGVKGRVSLISFYAFVAHLLHAYNMPNKPYVAHNLGGGSYPKTLKGKPNPKNPIQANGIAIRRAFNVLKDNGYIDYIKGFQDGNTPKRKKLEVD